MKLYELLKNIDDKEIFGISGRNNYIFVGFKHEWEMLKDTINTELRDRMLEEEHQTWIPIDEREVMEHYITEKYKIHAIRIEGNIIGRFWFKHEFDEAYEPIMKKLKGKK